MGSLTVHVPALESAVEKLTTLGIDVDNARRRVTNAVPYHASITTLTSSGAAGIFSTWAEDQAESPLTVVLDIAKLLDTQGNGTVTYTYTGDYSIETMTADLGTMVATRLEGATTKEDIQKYLDMAAGHEDSPDFQDAFLTGLGQAGVVSVLTHAGEAGVPMDRVTNAFSADSEAKIAGWVQADIVDPSNIDTETTTLLAGFGRSAEFSESLYSEVTPDQMTDAIQHLNEAAYPNGIIGDFDEDAQTLYSQFINGAGTTFATYTKAVDDPEALAETWFDAITDDDNQGNAAALTFLIRKGGENAAFDPDFLYNLTEDVYQWERDQDGAVWGPRVESGDNGMSMGGYLFDPDVVVEGDLDTIDAARRVDGLANLLGSMGHTSEAAQRFFANGYENGDPGGTNSRVEYLMLERTFSGSNGSDEGYGLGVALEAAAAGNTTHEYIPGIGYSDEWSAGFATDLFEFAADKNGSEDNAWILDGEYFGYPGTSVALGNIGAAYADDIFDIVGESDTQPTGPGHLQISAEDLQKTINMIGYHDDMSGLESLSAALLAEGNERYRGFLESYGPEGDRHLSDLNAQELLELTGVSDTSGEVLGRVLDWGLESKEYGEELDAKRAEFAAKAFDIATSFVPGAGDVIAGVKDTLWETAIDTAKDEGLGALKDAIENSPNATSGEYATQSNDQFENLIQYNTYDQLLATGYLDDFDIPDVLIEGEGADRRFREDIRVDGTNGLPDPDEEGISASERQQRIDDRNEVQEAINYLYSTDPTADGPGAALAGIIAPALDGYDRVRPEPEDG
ncbi:hypothetical protein [Aeromicrobium sp.]|uniref:hypothetical protein n=1 Tax=Aeromicrobium sp. TaxID=1871063 RepID=UPI002FC6AB3D